MLKKLLLSLTFLMCPLFLLADQLTLSENAPKTYIVKKGDTLWDISAVFLDLPWLWPKLWRLNPEIDNPHLIYPGDQISLVYDENGEPMLVMGTADGKPVYHLSPKIRQQKKTDTEIKLLPLEIVAPYIKYDHLFSAEQLNEFPHVIGNNEGYRSGVDGFLVYVSKELTLSKTYAIYNKGDAVIDPETNESLGFYVHLVATGQAINVGNMKNNEPATLKVSTSKRELRSGDYVVPVHEGQMLPSIFTMQAADKSMQGSIIKAVNKGREFGKLEVVLLNRGLEHQVSIGDVMSIKRLSPSIVETKSGAKYIDEAPRWNRMLSSEGSDYNMPQEYVGELMVFKVYAKTSMALIMRTAKPARLNDVVTAPE